MFTDTIEILLVEDSLSDVELTVHTLQSYHSVHRIHVVRDGEEALDFLFDPDKEEITRNLRMILLDLHLPKIDGLEVLARIKSDPRTQKIPVVALTTSREERDILESFRLGINSYIVKPVNFAQFKEAMQTLGTYWLVLNQPLLPHSS